MTLVQQQISGSGGALSRRVVLESLASQTWALKNLEDVENL